MKYFYETFSGNKTQTLLLITFFYFFANTANTQTNYNTFATNSSNDVKALNITTTVNKQMKWLFGGYRFTVQMPLDHNTYLYYKSLNKNQAARNFSTEYRTHPYLLKIARVLDEDAKELGYSGYKMVEYLTAFVQQNITYTKDPYNNGWDYPKFPIETLYEKKGDCEDSAILLATLLKMFGFDAMLISLPGHMATAVACSDCKTYYRKNGKKYAYIETTASNWAIGKIPDDYKTLNATLENVLYVPAYNRLQQRVPKYIEGRKTTTTDPRRNCNCQNKLMEKRITIGSKTYLVKPNQTYTVTVNGVRVTLANNN